MASIAPTGKPYDHHRVPTLPRLGAVLLAVLITAAGIAPIFTDDDRSAIVRTGSRPGTQAAAQPELSDSFAPLMDLVHRFQPEKEPAPAP